MPLTTKSLTQQIGVRLPQDLHDQVREFAEESDMGMGAAARVLIERGLKMMTRQDVRDITSIYFNAKMAALQTLEEYITDAVDSFREDEVKTS